jgi:hypothetical protein
MMARMKQTPGWTPSGAEGGAYALNIPSSQEEGVGAVGAIGRTASYDELQAVLDLSRRQVEEDERLRLEEEEALKKVLELSLLEK